MDQEAAQVLYNHIPRLGPTPQGWLYYYFEKIENGKVTLTCSPHQVQADSPWTSKPFKVPQALDDFARLVNSKYWHPVDWPSE